jgi:mycothiol system anti-sigma-R factor
MSCGDDTGDLPRDLRDLESDGECREVLTEVWTYLDGEVGDAEARHIEHHLDDCAPCLRKYGIERVVKALVARSCGQEDTPVTLRDRVMTSLRSVTVESGHGAVQVTATTTTVVTEVQRQHP